MREVVQTPPSSPLASRPRHDQYYAPELRHPNRPRDELLPVRSIQLKGNATFRPESSPETGSQKLEGRRRVGTDGLDCDHAKESLAELPRSRKRRRLHFNFSLRLGFVSYRYKYVQRSSEIFSEFLLLGSILKAWSIL